MCTMRQRRHLIPMREVEVNEAERHAQADAPERFDTWTILETKDVWREYDEESWRPMEGARWTPYSAPMPYADAYQLAYTRTLESQRAADADSEAMPRVYAIAPTRSHMMFADCVCWGCPENKTARVEYTWGAGEVEPPTPTPAGWHNSHQCQECYDRESDARR